jgi:cytochrome c oxidase cbb3-type subunit 1
LLFLIGFFMFAYNIYKTWTSNKVVDAERLNASPMGA